MLCGLRIFLIKSIKPLLSTPPIAFLMVLHKQKMSLISLCRRGNYLWYTSVKAWKQNIWQCLVPCVRQTPRLKTKYGTTYLICFQFSLWTSSSWNWKANVLQLYTNTLTIQIIKFYKVNMGWLIKQQKFI